MSTDKSGLRSVKTGVESDYPHFEDKTPIVLSQVEWREPKKPSTDVIQVSLDDAWSDMRSEAMGRRFFCYSVWNDTKAHQYACELFEGVLGEPCGRCNCPSSVPCKHMKDCLKDLLEREPTFGECFADCEFLVKVREKM